MAQSKGSSAAATVCNWRCASTKAPTFGDWRIASRRIRLTAFGSQANWIECGLVISQHKKVRTKIKFTASTMADCLAANPPYSFRFSTFRRNYPFLRNYHKDHHPPEETICYRVKNLASPNTPIDKT